MRAMILERPNTQLLLKELPIPIPEEHQLLIKVHACAVCRTDLHIVDGELPPLKSPLIPGHQIVGRVVKIGSNCSRFQPGDRVGISWLWKSCGECPYCKSGRENLCDQALYTGYGVNGGFADYCLANESFVFSLPSHLDDLQVAPLLCGGLIGYRALKMVGDAKKIGFYGFGSAAHILAQVIRYEERELFVFTRQGDTQAQELAMNLGATWTGSSDQEAPTLLEAAIIFAPVGKLVPAALRNIVKGGSVICAGIHMSDIPSFPYSELWGERIVRSVANLTRKEGEEFLSLAVKAAIKTVVTSFPLEAANQALEALRHSRIAGTAVIDLLRKS